VAFCQRGEAVPSGMRLASMPQDNLRETPGAVVMQIERMPGDGLRETTTPKKGRSPLTSRRRIFRYPDKSVMA